MPKQKRPHLTPEERLKLFEAEVKKRSEAGDFDHDAADAALDAMVRKSIKDHGP